MVRKSTIQTHTVNLGQPGTADASQDGSPTTNNLNVDNILSSVSDVEARSIGLVVGLVVGMVVSLLQSPCVPWYGILRDVLLVPLRGPS